MPIVIIRIITLLGCVLYHIIMGGYGFTMDFTKYYFIYLIYFIRFRILFSVVFCC